MQKATRKLFGFTLWSIVLLITVPATAQRPIEGRWNLTLERNGEKLPSWLEVRHSGTKTLVGYFVGFSGSVRPVSEVKFNDGAFSFSIPPQWESGSGNLEVNGRVDGDRISGSLVSSDGASYTWTGVRAPKLKRAKTPAWGKPVRLIQSNSLNGWKPLGEKSNWTVKNGILTNPESGANLATTSDYEDFKLHLEFRVPKGSNSGVYLRGRYEVQVTDSFGSEPDYDQLGAIYGFIIPLSVPAKPAGEWQSLDVTLIGRQVTVSLNGQTIIHPQEIPGITGGAMDSNEGAPGPLMIQGDHGAIEYRNIIITPAKK